LLKRVEILARTALLHRIPHLSTLAGLVSPIALPNGEICLPAANLQALQPDELDAVLAHEMAHLKRRDAAWLTIAAWIRVLFFFQPLNIVCAARIHEETERLCDQAALDWSGRGSALARALVKYAALGSGMPLPVPSAWCGNKGELIRRTTWILAPHQKPPAVVSTLARMALGCITILLLGWLAPVVHAGKTAADDDAVRAQIAALGIDPDNGQHLLLHLTGSGSGTLDGRTVQIKYNDVKVDTRTTHIVELPNPDSYFELIDAYEGDVFIYKLSRSKNGEITPEFRKNGVLFTYDNRQIQQLLLKVFYLN